MSESKTIGIKEVHTELLLYLTYAIVLFPSVPYLVNSLTLILWLACAVACKIYSARQNRSMPKSDNWHFLIFSGNYLFFALSLTYSIDVKEGLANLTTQLPALIFPLVFFLLPLPLPKSRTIITTILNIFLVSTLIMCVWILFRYKLIHNWSELKYADRFDTTFRDFADEVTGKHPTYLSLYLSFSIGIALQKFITYKTLASKFFFGIAILLMTSLLVLFASRTPIIASFLGLLFLLLIQIKKTYLRIVSVLLLIVFTGLIIRFTPAIYSRLQEVIDTEWRAPKGLQFNSTNIRAGIFNCTFELIGQRPILGYGIGGDKKALNECYEKFPTEAYKLKYYNTHNQYLNFWLLSGIASLAIFVFSLLYAFRTALRNRDNLFLYFLILCSISFLTENILSRQAGSVFYYFFICLFIFCPFSLKSKT